jgi:hypothetical protein
MKRTIATAFYWFAAITIALGAYGHGFVGIRPVEAAVAASTLAPDVVRVIWIVWYFVSGCMLSFGILLFWAWPVLEAGSASRASAALIIGAFYTVTGVAAYLYSGRDPFWLLFVIQGVVVIGSTLVLRRPGPAGGVRPAGG